MENISCNSQSTSLRGRDYFADKETETQRDERSPHLIAGVSKLLMPSARYLCASTLYINPPLLMFLPYRNYPLASYF